MLNNNHMVTKSTRQRTLFLVRKVNTGGRGEVSEKTPAGAQEHGGQPWVGVGTGHLQP